MSDDRERPRRSWREIDRMRDGATHPREGGRKGPSEERLRRSGAYRRYKSQLDKLFDGGGVPEALRSKLEEAGVGESAKRRKRAAQAIVDAREDWRTALDAYRSAFGFPAEEEALARLLDTDDEQVVLEAIAQLERLHESGGLRRARSLKARVQTAMMTLDDPDVTAAGERLLRLL